MLEQDYKIYINTAWHKPVHTRNELKSECGDDGVYMPTIDDAHFHMYAMVVISVRGDEVVVLRNMYGNKDGNKDGDVFLNQFMHIDINPSILTQLKIGVVPTSFIDYLVAKVPLLCY